MTPPSASNDHASMTEPTYPSSKMEPGPISGEAPDLALVMGGGGARAAYQVGFLRFLAREFPELEIPIVTGVSAGAINAALLASHHGTFAQAVEEMSHLWGKLTVEDVFKADPLSLLGIGLRWTFQLFSGGMAGAVRVRGLVDTAPLRRFLTEVLHSVDGELTGVQYNLAKGRLKALALSTSSYTTGQSVTWIQGSDLREWERPQRVSQKTVMSIDHVMASAALPLFFPAINIDDHWYGDGGIRLAAPLSPALHLGADRVIAISTRYARSPEEAAEVTLPGYPPPAHVVGVLLNSVFLDLLDQDALRLERLNQLLDHVEVEDAEKLRQVKLLVLRPSQDLGKLAGEFEPRLPRTFRFLTRGLGTRQKGSSDLLSLLLFQDDYVSRLMELGEHDAEARADEIRSFILDR